VTGSRRSVAAPPRSGHPRALLDKLAVIVADHLAFQIRSGAQAVQIFDSWAGILGPDDYRRVALPPLMRAISQLPAERGPVIVFAPAAPHLLELLAGSGADVVGLCWRTRLAEARARHRRPRRAPGQSRSHVLLGPPIWCGRARSRCWSPDAGPATS